MYKIHVLSGDDFDNLPESITRGSDISNSLGFADKRTGQAYVRYTGLEDLDKYLINHELEELEQDESTHEDENGIRHKSFGTAVKHFFLPPTILTDAAKKKKEKKERAAEEQAVQAKKTAEEQQAAISQAFGRFNPSQAGSQQTSEQQGGSVVGRLSGPGLTSGAGLNQFVSQSQDPRRFGNFRGRSINF